MRYISNIAAVAALASLVSAGNAPVIKNSPIGITYDAQLPAGNGNQLTGVVKASGAPNGEGTNFQITLYNLPGNDGNLTYGLYTSKVSKGNCGAAGAILDPYGGFTGSNCSSNAAGCQIGDLSDKHGNVPISSGGSGTGYFSANYVDEYLSMEPSSKSFFGHGSFVVEDASGTALICANFVNAEAQASKTSGSNTATSSTSGMTSSSTASATAGGASASSSASSTSSGSGAERTAVVGMGAAGLVGVAALLL